jgi:outer-membrane receptor for ferric coprogen and ferric-rhodotorulic acid
MHPHRINSITFALMLAFPSVSALAEEQVNNEKVDALPEVKVTSKAEKDQPSEKTKSYTVDSTSTATRLSTSIRETPQSISVITREQLDDFRVLTVNEALSYATGIKVEQFESERTQYTSRGFNITNFQIDGLSTPISFSGTNYGDLDIALYDRIEVLRGANGLLTGSGNPSATINFIRKRTTRDFQAKANASIGSWDNRRLDADVSGSLNGDGSIRGRLVLAHHEKNSYLDRYSSERDVAYGIIEADLTESTSLAIGHTYQRNDASSNMFGGLNLLYSDGSKRHYKASDSTAPGWSYRNVDTNISFAELTHYFNNDWKIKGQLTQKAVTSAGPHNYVDGSENRITGLGLTNNPFFYTFKTQDYVADIYANGPFELAGSKHELVVGATMSRVAMREFSRSTATTALTSFDAAGDVPYPAFSPESKSSDYRTRASNLYAAAKLNPIDALKVTLGGSLFSYKLTGESYTVPQDAKENNNFVPYIGAVYDLGNAHSVYASYSKIYMPQNDIGVDLKALAPLEGKNYEIGLKSEWLDQKLNSTFSLFRTEQKNQPLQIGTSGTRPINKGIEATTKGYEFDLAGELTDRLSLNAGYTRLMSIKGDQGQSVNTFTPKHLAHVSAVYKLPYIENLKVGASLNWQSAVHVDIGTVRYAQDGYAILNLMAQYKIDDHWDVAVNLYNVTDEKYLSSLRYSSSGQGYYAPPVNGLATLTWKY